MLTSDALRELSKVTIKGIFPYQYEHCWVYRSGNLAISVLPTRFLEGYIYDIRPYVKKGDCDEGETFNWLRDIAIQSLSDEKADLIKQKKRVEWGVMPVTYETVPIPPIPDSYCDGTNWLSIINMVLTWEKRTGGHEN